MLNRDTWSHPSVQALIKEAFLFWQSYHNVPEGAYVACSEGAI